MGAPVPGYVPLYFAVDEVGRRLSGDAWPSICSQADLRRLFENNFSAINNVISTIAEACEAGTLAAAFKHLYKGADELDRAVWRKPQWINYFADGEVVVDQPRLLLNGQPHPSGEMLPCSREIFVRKDSLSDFVKSLSPAPLTATRYPGDAALIEEGRHMLATGMTKRAVARALAPRAKGDGTTESTETRLRKAL